MVKNSENAYFLYVDKPVNTVDDLKLPVDKDTFLCIDTDCIIVYNNTRKIMNRMREGL